MAVICFVRHGETDWNAEGKLQGHTATSLNKKGIWQSRQCAEELGEQAWDLIVSSPLQRAVETADILAAHLQLPWLALNRFAEIDYGSWNGEKRNSLLADSSFTHFYREEIKRMEPRIRRDIEELSSIFIDKKIIVVTHGIVIQLIEKMFQENPSSVEKVIVNGSFIIKDMDQ